MKGSTILAAGGVIAAAVQSLGFLRPPGLIMLAANAIVLVLSLRSK